MRVAFEIKNQKLNRGMVKNMYSISPTTVIAALGKCFTY